MVVLDKWYISYDGAGYVACGIVYGHISPMCHDGAEIHTSLIEEAEYRESEAAFVLHTLNSEYHVNICDMHCECYDPMRSLWLFERFAQYHGLENSMERVVSRYREISREISGMKKALYGKLRDNSLYLEFTDRHDFYFERGLYRGSDGESEFFGRITDFDYDFTTLAASLNYVVEFIPYKHGNIQFISHSEHSMPGEFLGMICNSGADSLNIRFSWGGMVIIAPGTEMEIYEGMGAPLPLPSREQDN